MKFRNLFLMTFLGLAFSCSTQSLHVDKYQTHPNISINESIKDDADVVSFIAPYKKQMDNEMNRVISYTPVDLTKNGFDCSLCNVTADLAFDYILNEFKNQGEKFSADAIVLNYGGLRRTFNKGDLTIGNVYELSPFENEMYLLTMSGGAVKEMIEFLYTAEVGHPIANMQINSLDDVLINGEKFDPTKTYKIITNDYLYNGGDKMYFFAKSTDVIVLNLKLRDLLLEQFQQYKTLDVDQKPRIVK